jgi:digeranylgeranylglycerophospholipid reductase
MEDVIIIGAGPGGLYAGLLLAQKGFRVSILEEHETPGEPVHCTGVMSADAFDEYKLPRNAILNGLTSVTFFSPSGRTVRYSPDNLEAVVIDRNVFDRALCSAAESNGAQVIRGKKAVSVQVQRDHIAIDTLDQTLLARACILACGANYSIQRRLGLGFPTTFLQSAQVELPCKNTGDVEMYFGFNVAPRGFGWAVPIRRGSATFVRVGLMCDRNAERHFYRLLHRIAQQWGFEPSAKPRLRMLPLAPIQRTCSDRLIVIGDAAGLVKPTTGGGIYFSVVSARIAADVLAAAFENDQLQSESLSDYETRWKSELGGELEAQLTFRRLTDRLDDEQIEKFFRLAQTDGIIPLVRQTAKFNQHRDLVLALLKHPVARQIFFRKLFS